MNLTLPKEVTGRIQALGPVGRKWLASLPETLDRLTKEWQLTLGDVLTGGSHALVVTALQQDRPVILKIHLPELEGYQEFQREVAMLQAAKGVGYPKVLAVDYGVEAYLMEALGATLASYDYPVAQQMAIICDLLQDTWQLPIDPALLPKGEESVAWFREFIPNTWQQLASPCDEKVIQQALAFLDSREEAIDPEGFVLLHGDAHSQNTLADLQQNATFKLVDPEGVYYERAYDLGVLMREWPEEYQDQPLKAGRERCRLLSQLTGVEEIGIWQWGFLQMTATGLVLMQTGQKELGWVMLQVAESWVA